jgi:hypothetical protein
MRRPPTLIARQAAFLSTYTLLAGEIENSFDYHVDAAIIAASAMLVIGADLDDSPYITPLPQGLGNYCDDCGRDDGTHDPEVEH